MIFIQEKFYYVEEIRNLLQDWQEKELCHGYAMTTIPVMVHKHKFPEGSSKMIGKKKKYLWSELEKCFCL